MKRTINMLETADLTLVMTDENGKQKKVDAVLTALSRVEWTHMAEKIAEIARKTDKKREVCLEEIKKANPKVTDEEKLHALAEKELSDIINEFNEEQSAVIDDVVATSFRGNKDAIECYNQGSIAARAQIYDILREISTISEETEKN